MRKYILIIVDPIHTIYEDMMFMVMHRILQQGHECFYLYYHVAEEQGELYNDDAHRCIFFGTAYASPLITIPPRSIMTDFDQPHWVDCRWNMELIRDNHVYAFSRNVRDHLYSMYPSENIHPFEFGYSRFLDFGYEKSPTYEYDICFLGSVAISEHRQRVLSILKSKFKCYIHDRVEGVEEQTVMYNKVLLGKERADIYKKSKIVLSIPFSEEYSQTNNKSRIYPAVCTGGFVIAEQCLEDSSDETVSQICLTIPSNTLCDTISHYLEHDDIREELRFKHYVHIKSILTNIPTDP